MKPQPMELNTDYYELEKYEIDHRIGKKYNFLAI